MTSNQREPPPEDTKKITYVRPRVQQVEFVQIVERSPLTICPFCGSAVVPILSDEPSFTAWLLCIIIILLLAPFFCIGLLIGWLILSSGSFSSPRYICPVCGASIGGVIVV